MPSRKTHAMARKIGDLGRVGDSKSDNGALMPNTCLGENQETNINIYISTGEPDANGKKAAFVPLEKYDSKLPCFRCCKLKLTLWYMLT